MPVELKKIWTVRLTDEDLEVINENFIEADDTTVTKVFSRILDTALRKKTCSKKEDLECIESLRSKIERQQTDYEELFNQKKELDELVAAKFSEIEVLTMLNNNLTDQLKEKEDYNKGVEGSIEDTKNEFTLFARAKENEIALLQETISNQTIEIESNIASLKQAHSEIDGLHRDILDKKTEIEHLQKGISDRENTIIIEPNPLQLELIEAYRSVMVAKGGAMITQLKPGFIEPITGDSPKSKGNYLLNTFLFMIRGYKFDLLPQFPPKKIERVFASYLEQKGGQR